MKAEGVVFDHVIASPAVRVVETIDQVVSGYGKRIEPTWERRVYLASSATLMDVLREANDSIETVLMIGHNPSMEDIVLDLVPDGKDQPLRDAVYEKYPTAALAEIEIDIESWSALERNQGSLKRFVRPRDLDPSLGPEE